MWNWNNSRKVFSTVSFPLISIVDVIRRTKHHKNFTWCDTIGDTEVSHVTLLFVMRSYQKFWIKQDQGSTEKRSNTNWHCSTGTYKVTFPYPLPTDSAKHRVLAALGLVLRVLPLVPTLLGTGLGTDDIDTGTDDAEICTRSTGTNTESICCTGIGSDGNGAGTKSPGCIGIGTSTGTDSSDMWDLTSSQIEWSIGYYGHGEEQSNEQPGKHRASLFWALSKKTCAISYTECFVHATATIIVWNSVFGHGIHIGVVHTQTNQPTIQLAVQPANQTFLPSSVILLNNHLMQDHLLKYIYIYPSVSRTISDFHSASPLQCLQIIVRGLKGLLAWGPIRTLNIAKLK